MLYFLHFQQKFKDKRSERLMTLKSQARFVIEMVAEYLGMDMDKVLNEVVDYQSQVDCLNSLFAPGGRCAVLFYTYYAPPPDLGKYNMNFANC